MAVETPTEQPPKAHVMPEQAPAASPPPPEAPEATAAPVAGSSDSNSITWAASEFISHDKSASWYTSLLAVTIVVAVVIYLVTKDAVSVGVVGFGALMLAVYGSRRPRQLEYHLTHQGFSMGHKSYTFSDFRSFAVLPDGAFSSVEFMPLKRFGTPVTIYYPPEEEEKIMAILSAELPFEQRKRDAVDNLMKRIRF